MKKHFLLFFLIVNALFSGAQERTILQITTNLYGTLYNPEMNTLFAKHPDGNIKNNRFNLLLTTGIIRKGRMDWKAGVACARTNYRYVDKVHSIEFHDVNSLGNPIYVHHDYQDPADLVARSTALGIYNEVTYRVGNGVKYVSVVGLANETYLLEWYKSYYESTDDIYTIAKEPPSPYGPSVYVEDVPKRFFLSSSAVSVFYRISPNLDKLQFRPSLQVSIGTNAYSDWSQFRKCMWIGVGVNVELLQSAKE